MKKSILSLSILAINGSLFGSQAYAEIPEHVLKPYGVSEEALVDENQNNLSNSQIQKEIDIKEIANQSSTAKLHVDIQPSVEKSRTHLLTNIETQKIIEVPSKRDVGTANLTSIDVDSFIEKKKTEPAAWTETKLPLLTWSDYQESKKNSVAVVGLNSTSTVAAEQPMMSARRIGGDSSPQSPASIEEMARALQYDVDNIYEYVKNNIEYTPGFEGNRGALGTLLDNQGNALDQSQLMVALLRTSGYEADYISGLMTLNAQQMDDWFGFKSANTCSLLGFFQAVQIPIEQVNGSTSVDCNPNANVAVTSARFAHAWVRVKINGSYYVFDPSYKTYNKKNAINLNTATGYNTTTFMANAKSGSTSNVDYIQNLNRTNIRNDLTTYSNNLISYLRKNKPVASLDDVIGGKQLQEVMSFPRDTNLDTATPPRVAQGTFQNLDVSDQSILNVQYQGINQSFTSELLYGKRLTITFNNSNQPELRLDGQIYGSAGTAVAPGTSTNLSIKVIHNRNEKLNHSFISSIKSGGTYAIANTWGYSSRGLTSSFRSQLEKAHDSGVADTDEQVVGLNLALIGAQWTSQSSALAYMISKTSNSYLMPYHQVGVVGYYNNLAFVDLPSNSYITASQAVNEAERTQNSYRSMSTMGHLLSILESTTVQQVTNAPAASTISRLDASIASGQRIYKATNTNFANTVRNNLTSCTTTHLNNYAGLTNSGYSLILPQSCKQTLGLWSGNAYWAFKTKNKDSEWMAKIDGYSGGMASIRVDKGTIRTISLNATKEQNSWWDVVVDTVSGAWVAFSDPIDLTKGSFILESEDISVGVGSYPESLEFRRFYTSDNRTNNDVMGRGWKHNFDKKININTDGYQSLGEDSALDASAVLTALTVIADLEKDTAYPVDKEAVKAVVYNWLGDNLVDNTIVVQDGSNGQVFVKLTDGTFNSPPGNASKLIKNSNGTYTLDTLHHDKYQFNNPLENTKVAGKVTTYTTANGLQIKFSYDANGQLISVENSLGRMLKFNYAGKYIASVTDGSRTVNYMYNNTTGNLTGYKNTLGHQTTYQYDLPGRMTKIFYPSFPNQPFVTNVYDSLDRVKEQTNALGKTYLYGFAGSRSFEISPEITKVDGTKERQVHVNYMNANGQIIWEKDPLNRWRNRVYDAQSRVIKHVEPEGNSIEYNYDDTTCSNIEKRCTHNIKSLKRIPKPNSGLAAVTESMTYDALTNKLATSTDAKGGVTNYSYNEYGNLIKKLLPADNAGKRPEKNFTYGGGSRTGFSYFEFALNTSKEKINDTDIMYEIFTKKDATNKFVPTTHSLSSSEGLASDGGFLITNYEYDSVGNLTKVDGPRKDVNDTLTTVYNTERLPIQVTNALGKVTKYFYDADGRLIRTAAQLGTQWMVSCNSYSVSGNLTRSWGPILQNVDSSCPAIGSSIQVTDFTYDEVDRQSKVTEYPNTTTAQNRVTQTVYNLDNTIQSLRKDVGGPLEQYYAQYLYTPNGRLQWSVDALNNATRTNYDGFDRPIEVAYSTAGVGTLSINPNDTETFKYDNNGNIIQKKTRSGALINLSYDKLNRITAKTYPTEPASNISYSYNLLNQRTQSKLVNGTNTVDYVYSRDGRLRNTSTNGKTIQYQYDPAGNKTRITWPETTFFVNTSYDALNRPVSIKEAGTVNLASYTYDDLSRRSTITLGNGTKTSFNYNSVNQLGSLSHKLASTAQDVTFTYTRNRIGDITQNNWSNDLYQWKGNTASTTNYVKNGLNQYTAVGGLAQNYDANGNFKTDGMGWSYGYDLNNRLKTAVKTGTGALTATLNYDAEGRLRQTVIGNTTTDLLYDGTDLVSEYNGANVARRYVHGPGVDEPLVWYEGAGTAAKNWIYSDHLGSVIALANNTGTSTATYSYGPFGELNTITGNMRFRYTGQTLLAPLNLYYYKARIYSPTLGRFLQTDPIGSKDDMNLYAYVGNNTINSVDSTGMYAKSLLGLNPQILNLNSGSINVPPPDPLAFLNEPGLNYVAPEEVFLAPIRMTTSVIKNVSGNKPLDTNNINVIYRVPGTHTKSGLPYVGRANDLKSRAMGANDGRDRNHAEVIGNYPANDRNAARVAEQNAIIKNGGIAKLDNKRNEISEKKWDDKGVTY